MLHRISTKSSGVVRRLRVGSLLPLLAVLVLFAPIGAAAASIDGETTIQANVGQSIEVIAWPQASLNFGSSLTAGVPFISEPLTFRVRANTNWGITIASNSETGVLREYNTGGGAFVAQGHTTTNPLEWSLTPDGEWTALSSTPTLLVSDQPPTDDDGVEVNFFLRFIPSFLDTLLPEPNREYRIVLTYTVGVGY